MQQIPLELVQNIVDLQKDLIVLFYKNDPILINKAFKKFSRFRSFCEQLCSSSLIFSRR
ncbi:MAG: hypothetical protein QG559_1309 [Campylobacterota bacterium]|nr:hypothetical protein [Campylobacterota bacterium]